MKIIPGISLTCKCNVNTKLQIIQTGGLKSASLTVCKYFNRQLFHIKIDIDLSRSSVIMQQLFDFDNSRLIPIEIYSRPEFR